MATFAIIPLSGDLKLQETLPSKFGNKTFCLPKGEWLVSYDGTSRQLSDELGISDNKDASAMVVNFSAYWGRAGNDVWEWIKENGE